MANRPHVPKFGDWSNQDQPFTVNKRQDLYESLEKRETKTPTQTPPPQPQPQPPRRIQKPEPPKPVKEIPRAPPPTDQNNKGRAPTADQLYGAGGLYGGYGAGGGSVGNQRQLLGSI